MSPTSSVAVRPLRREDFDDLREIYWQLYDECDSGEPIGITLFGTRPSLADERAWYDGALQRVLDGDEICIVAELHGRAVGSCSIGRVVRGLGSEQSHVGELGILVGRTHRGKGVGTALLERALADARSKFEVVYLSVFSVNQSAQRLYEEFGFSVCGHLPRVVKRGSTYFDEERMVLDFSVRPSGVRADH